MTLAVSCFSKIQTDRKNCCQKCVHKSNSGPKVNTFIVSTPQSTSTEAIKLNQH